MVALTLLSGGTVNLTDARRGTERLVELLPFLAGVTPVTAAEFAAGRIQKGLQPMHARFPATGIRWCDAVAWCNTASEAEGLEPAYQLDGETVKWRPSADGYRLPTEAEWVYASRAGGSGPRHGALAEIAWTAADELTGPQPVGGKAANGFGLFDTLGNVWEWCWDRVDPARYGDYRLLKGGGWADREWSCRVGVRRGNAPDAAIEDVGFRVVRGAVANSVTADGGQGWSEKADQQRASLLYPLPVGWTPLQAD